MTAHDQHAPVAERGGDGGALLRANDQLGGIVEIGESLPEEDRVMVEQLECGIGRAERRGVWRMGVDDRADVGTRLVDLGVQDVLEVNRARSRQLRALQIERQEVARA